MIEKIPFGRTGHLSSRIVFGAAALGSMKQDRADRVLETLLEYGVNHIDTAASYGDSELRVGHWMAEHRQRFFLATKTHERAGSGARESLHRSLDRLQVDQVDLIQMHNLVEEEDWARALGPDGALESLVRAKEEGLVRFIGVTGHGNRVAAMHLRSLEHFDFDSVLLPCNYTMLAQPDYARDFENLVSLCQERGVAVQTIKSIARRRWQGDDGPRYSWYEPLREAGALERAVGFVMARDGLFLNSSSDATLLPAILDAASRIEAGKDYAPHESDLRDDTERLGVEALFVPGGPQGI